MISTPIERLRRALAGSVLALLAAAPGLAAETAQPQPAASDYVPTMADYQGIYDALQNYRVGLEKHDETVQKAAYWEDAARGGGRSAGAPSGANAGLPTLEELKKRPGFGQVWHLPLDSYIHFESATRARHYEYFLSIYPQPEKKLDPAELAKLPDASSYRNSILGWPGHYDDILEKRNGEWRILQRQMGMGTK
jgi:hypothetical protein